MLSYESRMLETPLSASQVNIHSSSPSHLIDTLAHCSAEHVKGKCRERQDKCGPKVSASLRSRLARVVDSFEAIAG